MPLRLVFMGTPEFAVPTLVELAGAGHEIVAVYSRPPQPAGRGLAPQPSAVARQAERLGLAVLTPKSLRGDDAAAAMQVHGADAAVVVAYGLILPKPILDAFPLGAFNVHASLLPRWRGAAPIHRAVMAGDQETGVTVMKMEEGLDTGPIVLQRAITIAPDATTGDLHDDLARLGASLMAIALGALERGSLQATPQPQTGVTYAAKIDKSETRIDWTRPWQEVHNHCRGLSSFPGAWSELAGAGRIKILRTTKGAGSGPPGRVLDDKLTIACGAGAVRLVQVQRAGRQPMLADEFLRGTPVAPQSVLA
ncbi:MAG TPA: methionyl-tRNA formyltransferase [Xanthobacteraceae bacterium]|nr:methionyl-tRNA formyltransferase [Xanthobacteraceae bacterium]